MKKVFIFVITLMFIFAITACGGSGEDSSSKIDPDAVVTVEKYHELQDAAWSKMSCEEMEQFLGVRAVIDEKRTEEWGEGYLVADFPGPDSSSNLHVLFSQGEDGKWKTSSLSTTGVLSQ